MGFWKIALLIILTPALLFLGAALVGTVMIALE